MHALIIDDSRMIRTVVRDQLAGLGFGVSEAADGEEGLARLRELDRVDVVLVDWNMPVMDGLGFVRAVRADGGYGEVPLMMVTTESDMDHIVTALEAGADEYMMKPFTREALAEKLGLLGLSTDAPPAAA